jgi:hypothetical protein
MMRRALPAHYDMDERSPGAFSRLRSITSTQERLLNFGRYHPNDRFGLLATGIALCRSLLHDRNEPKN